MRPSARVGLRTRLGSIVKATAIIVLLAGTVVPATADTPPKIPTEAYLKGAPIDYPIPAAPDNNSDTGMLDLYLVRTAQRDASPATRTEAFDDASAYFFDDLLPRFSEAAGSETPLTALNKPILAHMLEYVLNDAMYYSSDAKYQRPRTRPFAEGSPKDAKGNPVLDANNQPIRTEIGACFTFKLGWADAYPSGHSANGYSTALLLAEIYDGRRAQLLARGARYGDNRVVCGVHHPSDVERGRAIARAMFAKLLDNQAFKDDLACAREEASKTPAAYSPVCAKKYITYRDEMVARATGKLCATYKDDAIKPAICPAKPATK